MSACVGENARLNDVGANVAVPRLGCRIAHAFVVHVLDMVQVSEPPFCGAHLLSSCAFLRQAGKQTRPRALGHLRILHLIRQFLDLLKVQRTRIEQCLEQRLLFAQCIEHGQLVAQQVLQRRAHGRQQLGITVSRCIARLFERR